MNTFLLVIASVLIVLSFASLYRAFKGPTVADRVAAINVVSIKITAVIVLFSVAIDELGYINVALVYAMIAYVATLGVAKYLRKGALD